MRHCHTMVRVGVYLGPGLGKGAVVLLLSALPMLLTGCGSSSAPEDSGASSATQNPRSQVECPPVPIWDRHVGPGDEFEMAASPEDAVLELSAEIGSSIVISSSQTAESGDEVTVFVVDNATDERGSYRVVRESRGWSVDGGEGCAARGPVWALCPTPKELPDGDFQVSCVAPEENDN